jgi:hypothetical protein
MALSRRGFLRGVAGLFVAAAAGELLVPEPKIYALGAMPGTEVVSGSHGVWIDTTFYDWAEALESMDTPFLGYLQQGDVIMVPNQEIIWVSGFDRNGNAQIVRGWNDGPDVDGGRAAS